MWCFIRLCSFKYSLLSNTCTPILKVGHWKIHFKIFSVIFCHISYNRLYLAVNLMDVCLLSYVLATSKVISGRVSTCDSVHSWQLYSAAWLGDQATSTMTWYPTVTVSWHKANESLPFPNNDKRLAGKRQVSILRTLGWLDQGWIPQGLSPSSNSQWYIGPLWRPPFLRQNFVQSREVDQISPRRFGGGTLNAAQYV